MAKQNFLSGGYYGKLGVTVGQRWKNKRTIRTYVIPANPRTPAQQANRSGFGAVVPYAQVGMAMNYKASCVQSADMTEWNVRMSIARELVKNGEEGLNLIPLYPVNFSLPYSITSATIKNVAGATSTFLNLEGVLPEVSRKYSVLLDLYNEDDEFIERKLYSAETTAEDTSVLEVFTDDPNELNSHCYCRIVSNDDTDSATDLVASTSLRVQAPAITIVAFDSSIRSLSEVNGLHTLTFNQPYGSAMANYTDCTCYCVVSGAWVTKNLGSGTLINNGGYCALQFQDSVDNDQNRLAMPSGAYFAFGNLTTETATTRYTSDDVQESYTQTNLEREIMDISQYGSGGTYSLILVLPLPYSGDFVSKGFASVKTNRWWAKDAVETMTLQYGSANGNLGLFFANGHTMSVMVSGCYADIPKCSIELNGVSYYLDAQRLNNLTNGQYVQQLEIDYDGMSSYGDEATGYISWGNVQIPADWGYEDYDLSAQTNRIKVAYMTGSPEYSIEDMLATAYQDETLTLQFTCDTEFADMGMGYVDSPRTSGGDSIIIAPEGLGWSYDCGQFSIPIASFS